MDGDAVVLLDGLQVFEVEDYCRALEKGGVRFRVESVASEECGIVESRKNNWASGLTLVMNYFNRGGLSVHMRISVHPDDVEKATAALEASKVRNPIDKKTVAIVVLLAVCAILFVYAFATKQLAAD
jgi:hypothetical protein